MFYFFVKYDINIVRILNIKNIWSELVGNKVIYPIPRLPLLEVGVQLLRFGGVESPTEVSMLSFS
jgi:hypothetical protein